MTDQNLLVCLLSENAKMPSRTNESAGYDLSASESVVVPARGMAIIPTGLALTVPSGTYGRIAPRSGLSCKHTSIGAGVIDRDYTGEIKIVFFNHADSALKIAAGDRVAQLILEMHKICPVMCVESLTSTARGTHGFGSSGV